MKPEVDNKYIILNDETIVHNGHTLYRIQATKDFSDVKKGDKGGRIQNYTNLSQEGDCWLYNESKSYGSARISDNVKAYSTSQFRDDATVYGDVLLLFNTIIQNYATVYGRVRCGIDVIIEDSAEVHGDVILDCGARISRYAELRGNASIIGNIEISDNALLEDNVEVMGNVTIKNSAHLADNVIVNGDVTITGDAFLCGQDKIINDVIIKSNRCYMTFIINDYYQKHTVTYTQSNRKWAISLTEIMDTEEFLKYEQSLSKYAYKLAKQYVEIVKDL